MTESSRLPLHRLELASGVYRITTATAIYEISVTESGLQKDGVHEVQQADFISAQPDSAARPLVVEDSFYREISEEMLTLWNPVFRIIFLIDLVNSVLFIQHNI